jgi:hypothetical protein
MKATRNEQARYFNDLGIVARIRSDEVCATILLVPRIPQSDGDYPADFQMMSKRQQRMFKFTPRVFDYTQANSTNIDGIIKSTLDSRIFYNGLLAQPFTPAQLVVEEDPPLGELIPFHHANFPPLRTKISTSIRRASAMTLWSPGDKLIVVCGSFQGMLGQLVTLEVGRCSALVVLSSVEQLQTVSPEQTHQSFSIDDLRRYFQIGDSIEVCEGREKGRHGIVILSSEDDVTFTEDKEGNEVAVLLQYELTLLNLTLPDLLFRVIRSKLPSAYPSCSPVVSVSCFTFSDRDALCSGSVGWSIGSCHPRMQEGLRG